MPYINQLKRDCIDPMLEPLEEHIHNEGDLTYAIYRLMLLYIKRKGESYAVHNDIMGTLECVKLELYRRQTANYENRKVDINGDVIV